MSHEYLPITDMMSGLMMVFLFIAVVFMVDVNESKRQLEAQKGRMAAIAGDLDRTRSLIRRDLLAAFKGDLGRWDAEVLDDTTVRFRSPRVLFKPGKSELEPRFKGILGEFFPRYVKILYPFRGQIEALRIEGHTSRSWGGLSLAQRYLKNMRLSEERALETLDYCYRLVAERATATVAGAGWRQRQDWLHRALSATGRSFGHPVLGPDGREDQVRSRRVEFKVVVKAEAKLEAIRAAAAGLAPAGSAGQGGE